MNTAFLLVAQYGTALIPVDRVARDYFGLTTDKFLRKALAGDIGLPIVRMERSQKGRRGVHVADLAAYLEARRADADKEAGQLAGGR